MTEILSQWAWPQWTYAGLFFLNLLMAAAMNGKPRSGEHNFAMSVMATLIGVIVLSFGGFFGHPL